MALAYPSAVEQAFCSDICPCQAERQNFGNTTEYSKSVFQKHGAKNLIDCKHQMYHSKLTPHTMTIDFLKKIEDKYDCSGLCKPGKFFYFSDVNKGVPTKECHSPIKKFLNSNEIKLFLEHYDKIFLICSICGLVCTAQVIISIIYWVFSNREREEHPSHKWTYLY